VPNLYGFFISAGIFLSILFAQKLIKKKEEDILWGLSFWAVISGIIGARIYHVIDFLDYYSKYPINILRIWNGGLGIWGGLTGGVLGSVLYLKVKRKKILPWLDAISVVTPLGQSIGRWGNFFNKEIFGKPTTLPWGLYIKPQNRPVEYLDFERFHPLFIYESILNLILFVILFKTYKKHHGREKPGSYMSLYLGGYSIIRFFMEFLRINPWTVYLSEGFSLNVSQGISILVLIFSIVFNQIRTKNDLHIFRS
jgi:phosphatidylglycerol:prolipoprotein diacylglycerol transferase